MSISKAKFTERLIEEIKSFAVTENFFTDVWSKIQFSKILDNDTT